jgi:hypothetical protein
MSSVIEYIEIDEDNRIAVYQDEWSQDDSPLDWGWGITFHEIGQYGRYTYDEAENSEGDTAIRMYNGLVDNGFDRDQALRGMHLWMVASGDNRRHRIVTVNVYRDSYHYIVLYNPEDGDPDGFIRIYRQWMNGDVYMLVHEKRERWTATTRDDTMDTWDEVNNIGGNYLNDKYTAEMVARDHFDLPEKIEK